MNRKLFGNLTSLFGIQAFSYIVPLLTLPYLARILGVKEWGALAVAEAYANYVSILLEFNFAMSATRQIAFAADNHKLRGSIIGSVFGAQILLLVLISLLTFMISFLIPDLLPSRSLLIAAFLLAIFRSVIPVWYFQGVELMHVPALLNIMAGFVGAALIFVTVKKPSDASTSLEVRALAFGVAALVSMILVAKREQINFPTLRESLAALREGIHLFIFRSTITFYTTANVLILGLLVPRATVALFAGAEKIAKAAVSAISPVSTAFFPRISNEFATKNSGLRKTQLLAAALTVGLAALLSLILFFAAPLIVSLLLGHQFLAAVPILRVLASLPLIIGVSNVLAIQYMFPRKMDLQVNISVILAAITNVCLAAPLTRRLGGLGMAISVTTAEGLIPIVLFSILFISARKRSEKWPGPTIFEGTAVTHTTTNAR